jgi:ATP-dependent DNA helicase RecQ
LHVRIVTLRYSDGLQGFPEDAVRAAAAGQEIIEARDHFFVHGGIPHLALVLLLGDGASGQRKPAPRSEEDPELALAESLRPLYRTLRRWRNEEARKAGIPSYAIMRNAQLAEICRRQPRTLAALREIEGIGESSCTRYGAAILELIPSAPAAAAEPEASPS